MTRQRDIAVPLGRDYKELITYNTQEWAAYWRLVRVARVSLNQDQPAKM